MNIGLFRMFLSRHTKTRLVSHSKLNQDSSMNSTRLQSLCIQPLCSAPSLLQFAWCLTVNKINTIGLHAYWPLLWSLFQIIWFETISPFVKRNCLRACITLALLCWQAVNQIYWSLFDVVVRGWPSLDWHRTCSFSWNWVYSLAMIFLATPTVSTKLLYICHVSGSQ